MPLLPLLQESLCCFSSFTVGISDGVSFLLFFLLFFPLFFWPGLDLGRNDLTKKATENVVHPHRQCGEEGATAPLNHRRLKRFGLAPKTLTNFYRRTIENILSCCITAWYSNCTGCNRRALHREKTTCSLTTSIIQKARSAQVHHSWDRETEKQPLPVHPAIIQKAGSVQVHQNWYERLKNSFYLKAIRLLNSHQ